MRRALLSLLVAALPLGAFAQEAADSERDRDFLTAFLEDNLSSLGRAVRIDGFRGALSSRATFDLLTIADSDGVWLTIRDGAIGWNRAALLSGRVEIGEMSAAVIELPRQPVSSGTGAEASGFVLPELPVAVEIGKLTAGRVALGEAVFGAVAEVSLLGSMKLEGGEGSAELAIDRIDGPFGRVAFTGSYANATRRATLDLLVSEGANGIAASLIGLPGTPSVELAVHGAGIIDDFRADVSLLTDGAPRLTGAVTLISAADVQGAPERRFQANLSGDITPLLLPDYRAFIGTDVSLEVEGRRLASGQMDLSRMVLSSKAFDLSGRLSIGADGLPREAALTARLGLAGAGEVLLPFPGERSFVQSGDLKLRYDQARGNGWSLDGAVHGLKRAGTSIATLKLKGSGRIAAPGQDGVDRARAGGTLVFDAAGIAPDDPALARAIGPAITGKLVFDWTAGNALRLPLIDVTGAGVTAQARARISGSDRGDRIEGAIAAGVADLDRFSGLVGRPLGGSGDVTVEGTGGLLSGFFDLNVTVTGRDLKTDQAELDRLLAGEARVAAAVLRDTSGITIRKLDLRAATLVAEATGTVRSGASTIDATLDFSDLSVLGGGYTGAIKGRGSLVETDAIRHLSLDAEGRDLGIGLAEIDRVMSGVSSLQIEAREEGGDVRLERLSLRNPQLDATAQSTASDGARRLEVSARLANMALLAQGFDGPLTAGGILAETTTGYSVDLAGTGPGATSARVTGHVARDRTSADLDISGTAQSALVNPFIAPRNLEGPVGFDLRLSGPLALSSLSGRATLGGGRLVAPTFGVELEDATLAADLADSRAVLTGEARVRGGGRIEVSGPVALTRPFLADITVNLRDARFRDPELYDTSATGTVLFRGPLTGRSSITGQIALGRTEIRIPSSSFGSAPVLSGLVHLSEGPGSRLTRKRAGLLDQDRAGRPSGAVYDMDLTISAPERVFVRGRGLDAEMGGTLRLGGTTEAIMPSGQFSLIRGRLDLLGKRFSIDEGLVEMQGALTPYVRFVATIESDGTTVSIVIEGNATEPEIRFVSSSGLPEEEVIAQILFGRALSSLSPLQAAQLASAIATLAGRGGEGIVGKLRASFGLDDLDIAPGEDGSAALRAGKYLSERVYTDVTIGSDGKSEINLNLDLNKSVTARGTLGTSGSTGIGVYWERDY